MVYNSLKISYTFGKTSFCFQEKAVKSCCLEDHVHLFRGETHPSHFIIFSNTESLKKVWVFFNLVPSRVSSLLYLYSGIQEAVQQSDWLFTILRRSSVLLWVNGCGMSKFDRKSHSLPNSTIICHVSPKFGEYTAASFWKFVNMKKSSPECECANLRRVQRDIKYFFLHSNVDGLLN